MSPCSKPMEHLDSQRLLIPTVDYEIFGNGSGDVRQHMVEPAERMACICERYDCPLTIFFEVEEYLAFERNAAELRRTCGYDPAALIREQVASLVRRGHRFQLHLHPQWYGASLRGDRWLLRPEIETVDRLFESADEASAYIAERKKTLETLTSNGGRIERVLAYRAGAFSARPGEKLLAALRENEILFESSVVRGLFNEGENYTLDYREARSPKSMWPVSSDVTQEDSSGSIWEVPIHSVARRRFQQITSHRLRAKFSRNVPSEQRSAMIKRFVDPQRPLTTVKSLFERVPTKLDYHNLDPVSMYGMIKSADWNPQLGPIDVLIAIGHTKEHVEDRPLAELLRLVAEDPQLRLGDFGSLARTLRAADSSEKLERVPLSRV